MPGVEVNILGGVEVIGPRGRTELAGRRHRALVAALALRPGAVLPLWRLVEALWGERPPRTAVRSLHSHVARLRLALDASGLGGILQTREPGYLLAIDATAVDAYRFEQQTRAARDGVAAGMAGWAADVLAQALELWRGEALADADPVGWTAAEAARLADLRLAAQMDRCEVLTCLGRPDEALGDIERLLAADPTRERLVGLRMLALTASGRPTEALNAYQRLRVRLAEELGVDPSPELADLHTALLRGAAPGELRAPGTVLGRNSVAATGRNPVAARPPRPAQLPAPVGYFTGRGTELGELSSVIETGHDDVRPVVLISGQGGIGKTSLAVQWAVSVTDRFPDGQLFVNLRGHDRADALAPAEVVAVLLRCLGVPDDRLPTGLAERVALYRTILADQRMLVVLDDVGSTEQVLPVIPGSAASLLVLTSRNSLVALVTHTRVHTILPDLFSQDEATDLMAKMLGAERVGRERDAVAGLTELCGRLPLALRIAAAKLAMRPTEPIAVLVEELSDGDRLAHLSIENGSRDVSVVFASAYRSLSLPAMRLFRLLGLHPGPHLGAPLAAALCGLPADVRRPALAELIAAHLIAEPQPGRYQFHDLVRLFARRCALTDEPARARAEVAEKLLDWYLVGAEAATRVLDSHLDRVTAVLRHPAPELPFPAVREYAIAFLESERENLLPIVRYAEEHDQPAAACQLTYLLTSYFDVRGDWSERVEMCQHGVRAARQLGDPVLEAEMHRVLGVAYRTTHQLDRALDSHNEALALLRPLGDEAGLAYVYNNIGGAFVEMRRFTAAIEAYETALRLHDRCGNQAGAATAQRNLGYVHVRMGRADLSFAPLHAALATSRSVGLHRLEASTLNSLGEAHLQQLRHDPALDCLHEALAVSRKAGDRRYQMVALGDLGRTYLARGDPASAVGHLDRALQMSRRLGHRHIEARTLNQLGEAQLRLANLDEARRCLTASASLRRTVPDRYEQACVHRNLGDLAELTGSRGDAQRHWSTAVRLYREANATEEAEQLAGKLTGETPLSSPAAVPAAPPTDISAVHVCPRPGQSSSTMPMAT
ncbi:AfsR/SARP family transcriptional regulator [Salinispora vitiensis]|uniref:AfsR/SARP family transcriptional regulator n=1 Tax=Salinispora vitiensis TaxID=999544 RepID=UPI000475A860|nr:BTAD domain-containing putative transcriptional regulator [Salinispora vitiensis]